MKLIDEKFKTDKRHYMLQCALAGVAMALVLAAVAPLTNVAVVASLGASAFIVFALPHVRSSAPRFLIGGYAIAVIVGSLCLWVRWHTPLPQQFGRIPDLPGVLFGAAAVAATMFTMVITNSEHPPAAGVALGFVLLESDQWNWITPTAVMAGVVALCAVKHLLRRFLKNLL